MRTISLFAGALILAAGVGLFFRFGTITPCGMFKQSIREQFLSFVLQKSSTNPLESTRNGLAFALVGTAIDNLAASLSPYQCIQGLIRMSTSEDNPFLDQLKIPNESSTLSSSSTVFTPPEKPKWEVSKSQSKIDDSQTVVLRLSSLDKMGSGYLKTTPTLFLRCKENETEAFINFGTYVGFKSLAVTYRFDKNPAINTEWDTSTDNEATFIPQPVAFIKQLLAHQTLLVRVNPPNKSPSEISFDLTGLQEVVAPLQEACNWK